MSENVGTNVEGLVRKSDAIAALRAIPNSVPHTVHVPSRQDLTSGGTPFMADPYDYQTTRAPVRQDFVDAVAALPVTDSALKAVTTELCAVLTELLAALKQDAPGTALNNHRYDALGVRAYAAVQNAGALL